MRIALIGYGKMGHAIEAIALQRGHEICLKINSSSRASLTTANLQNCDTAIEFTNPESAVNNMMACFDAGLPVVCGSTGWMQDLPKIEAACAQKNGALIYASNFSVGVNLFFALNQKLASLLANHPEYKVQLEETHHTAKKDAPSGTAISLADQILACRPNLQGWVNHETKNENELPILSHRIDPAPGAHKVLYASGIDDIEIIHTAHNRTGFATGAVLAAEYLQNKKGIYRMSDVLGI